jgi:hypothetical protein
MKRVIFLVMVSLGATARGQMTLVEDGQPKAAIVVAADPGPKVKIAVEELQRYLEKISGAKPAIIADSDKPAGPLILVGASRLTDELGAAIPSGVTNARREEGFVIRCAGDHLILAGNDDGPYHGTEYAVYDFLRRLGVRWFMPGDDGEFVPSQRTITVAPLDLREKPDFIMRNWWLHILDPFAEQEKRWKLRNKMNPELMFAIPGDSSARNILPAESDQSRVDRRSRGGHHGTLAEESRRQFVRLCARRWDPARL